MIRFGNGSVAKVWTAQTESFLEVMVNFNLNRAIWASFLFLLRTLSEQNVKTEAAC